MSSISGNDLYNKFLGNLSSESDQSDRYKDALDGTIADTLVEFMGGFDTNLDKDDAQVLIDLAQSQAGNGASIETVLEELLSLLGIENADEASEGEAGDLDINDFIVEEMASEIYSLSSNGVIVESKASELADMLGIEEYEARELIRNKSGNVNDIIIALLEDDDNYKDGV